LQKGLLPKQNSNDEIVFWLSKRKEAASKIPDGELMRLTHEKLEAVVAKSSEHLPKYAVDELVESRGHAVLRLPPYNPDLNPIGMILIISPYLLIIKFMNIRAFH